MNESRTPSILLRAPLILAVTAASYGLPMQPRGRRPSAGAGQAVSGVAAAAALEHAVRDTVAPCH